MTKARDKQQSRIAGRNELAALSWGVTPALQD